MTRARDISNVITNADLAGDIDVDGTANLDVVDIDGAVDMASTLGVSGLATLSGNANITGDTASLTLTDTSSHSANTGPGISFFSKDSGGTSREVAKIVGESHSGSNEGNLAFQTRNGGTLETKWKIFKNGNMIPSNSGYGIYLGTTSVADSNLIDDYEEGTFTPTVFDSGGNTMSLSTSQGYYTKIGRTVHFNFYIVLASSGNTFAGNQVYIGGLPFTASSATNNVNMQQMVRSLVDSTSGYSEVISYIAPSQNYSQLLHGGDNIAFDNFRGTALNNSCQFQQVGHYFVA